MPESNEAGNRILADGRVHARRLLGELNSELEQLQADRSLPAPEVAHGLRKLQDVIDSALQVAEALDRP